MMDGSDKDIMMVVHSCLVLSCQWKAGERQRERKGKTCNGCVKYCKELCKKKKKSSEMGREK